MDFVRRLLLGGTAALALSIATLPAKAETPTVAQISGGARAVAPVLTAEQREIYAKAFAAADAGRWDEVRRLSLQGKEALANKVLRWLELQQPRSGVAFEDLAAFIDANPDWPMQDILMRRAEEALVERTDDSLVLAWFALRGPSTSDGAMRYADALFRAGDRAKAIATIKEAWRSGGFGAKQEASFLKRYRQYLTSDDHVRRLDKMIWDGRYDEARRVMKLIDANTRALADARIRLANMSGGIDGALKKVPESLQKDPGLLFERMRWRRRKGQVDGALEIARNSPRDLGRPDIWWPEREYLARKAVSAGKMSEAYKIVRDHQLTGGSGLAEAEFLSGWIALRYQKDSKAALAHFTRLYENARFPVTQARGAYWAGRAAEAAGDKKAAQGWYHKAAQFPITFYGQLGLEKLEAGARPPWPTLPQATAADRRAFEQSELTRVARLLSELGAHDRVKPFIIRHVSTAKSPAQHALAGELALALDRPDLAVSAAKRSSQLAGVMLPEYGWPVSPNVKGDLPERALIHATIRQESAFEVQAISRAGARGMMQLMPATAKAVAKSLGLAHSDHRLLNDPHYNIQIGRTYLGRLIDEFDGSYVLALAAYNAGPARARQWMRENGDPRRANVDVIDWIELISFEETRNYVQRVLENLQVYRQVLGDPQRSQGIGRDLRRGAS
ncbi:MAG TPA: lytic transglycosylase domain-containing protein [Alphaproteobacteria bacterium]|nr:lytic transglycosylase domain-containing protein [Alphaproteobacteria bacterium]